MVQVFPYLPWMVQHLIPDLHEKDIGYYSGLIASFQFVGRILGSFVWGLLADKFGRRIVLIISGVLLAFVTLGFGFSTTVIVAIIFRFLIGFFNGIVPTAKAVISEYSDDSTQPFAMGFLGGVFSLGLVFSSGLSGILADPIMQYDIPKYEIFVKYPFVLPGAANAAILLIGVIIVYFFMKEPVKEQTNTHAINVAEDQVYSEGENETDEMLATPRTSKTRLGHQLVSIVRKSIFYHLITDWVVMLTIFIYSLFSVVTMSLDEVLPLWVKAPRDLGGLEMSIKDFSIVVAISALITLPFSLFIFQILEKLFGGLRSFSVSIAILIPVCILIPSASALSAIPAVVYLGLFNLFMRLFISAVFASLSMFINNSVTPDKLGAVNGLSLSICSIFRAMAPIYGGTVFAVSLNTHIFPFDYHFIFVLNGIALVLCIVFGMLIPESLNRKKIVKLDTLLDE
ncbi:Protein ZINC INDUCED FACILITATOR-LIKE 1 isoform X2 [Oopsacas minuta]|uniref:Protein ZINC INDUCED FACILITATOR-LIKE 1 isoform X2 n=1 Tax=Oopsacas minuta TaxID=111878 RepID=A0AAV7JNB0_9METZ|nr:Protein ZINC INDUCED FACILITATOR-LIKE 1 isoform X2 [Oopsacas minuta]